MSLIFTENQHASGTLTGVQIGDPNLGYVTKSQKIWAVSSALGNMAFAYSFSMILIEIQVLEVLIAAIKSNVLLICEPTCAIHRLNAVVAIHN